MFESTFEKFKGVYNGVQFDRIRDFPIMCSLSVLGIKLFQSAPGKTPTTTVLLISTCPVVLRSQFSLHFSFYGASIIGEPRPWMLLFWVLGRVK